MTNLTGQSLGRYHILEQLGEGGMATVYKAYDTRLESDVAVKVIRTENLAPSILNRALKRFEREAKSLAKLTHANIVNVLDYGEYDGKPYLVMPYLPGGTLKAKLNGRPVPWQEAARILLPIARALGYAHEQGMIHRDVKPANILITHSGDPMLTDFGIAKIIDEEATQDLTGTSAAVGTPEYMAPEQVTAKSVDHRADIYALGVVFYEMVTGRKPFQADTPMAVLFKHASEPLPRPTQFAPELPDAVEKILLKALAKKAENRYASMGELAAALEKLAQGFPGADLLTATQAGKVSEGKQRASHSNESVSKRWWLSRPLAIVAIIGLLMLGLALLVINWPGETILSPSILALETPSPALLPGATRVREVDGMVMIYVPAGPFTIGSDEGENNEKPARTVTLDAFWIDQTEVTNAMFNLCVQDGRCTLPRKNSSPTRNNYYNDAKYANYPVIYVSWEQANTYCAWAGSVSTGSTTTRLPTEAEWEKAARGIDGRIYPWGNQTPWIYSANYNSDLGDTSPVGSFPNGASPYGALDMAGNVWEWVADWYSPDYYSNSSSTTSPTGPNSGRYKVLRGGAWDNLDFAVRSTFRNWDSPTNFDYNFGNYGFRCASSP